MSAGFIRHSWTYFVVDSYERCNETSGSVKAGEHLENLMKYIVPSGTLLRGINL
jgi:hypothetical protein